MSDRERNNRLHARRGSVEDLIGLFDHDSALAAVCDVIKPD
jgi:hypothetical protein